MKKILILGTKRFTKYLSGCETSEQFHQRYDVKLVPLLGVKKKFGNYASYLQHQLECIKDGRFEAEAVTGTNDISSLLAASIASAANISGPKFQSMVNCQDKKRSRDIQQQHTPEHTVKCEIVPSDTKEPFPTFDFPVFIKPRRSSLSKFSARVDSNTELQKIMCRWRSKCNSFNKQYRNIINTAPQHVKHGYTFENTLLVEHLFELPRQVTVDGICVNDRVQILGVTSSHFLENTLSFSAFHTPHTFASKTLKKRIFNAVRALVRGSDFNQGWFNVEVAYEPTGQRVIIVEINARMSSQFARMYDHTLEPSVLEILTRTVCSDSVPAVSLTENRHARCYILRKQHDALVKRRPKKAEIRQLKKRYPGTHIYIFAKPNRRLSDLTQDDYTFRYAQIQVLSDNPNNCEQIYQQIKREIDQLFIFQN